MIGALVLPSNDAHVGPMIPRSREFVSVIDGGVIKNGVWLMRIGSCVLNVMAIGGVITPGPPSNVVPLIASLLSHPAVVVRAPNAAGYVSCTVKIISGNA